MEDITLKPKTQTQNSNGQPADGQVSAGPKEMEKPVSDFIKPSEELAQLDREVQNAGVETVSEKPKLDLVHDQIGVKHAPADTPVSTEPSGKIVLPLTEEEAEKIVAEDKGKISVDQHGDRTAYTVPSRLGLATLVLKLLKIFR